MEQELNLNFSMPKNTSEVFHEISNLEFINKFTLIGGTALSIRIKHRLSEDLDFIIDKETINNTLIKREIRKSFSDYKLIRDDKDYQLDFIINNCKVTFIATGTISIPFKIKKYSTKHRYINIATISIIAVLKLSALAQRNTIRDYYDLYCIAKYHINLKEIIKNTQQLNPNLSPITYTETLSYTKDIVENNIENYLNPKESMTKQELGEYFSVALRKIYDNE